MKHFWSSKLLTLFGMSFVAAAGAAAGCSGDSGSGGGTDATFPDGNASGGGGAAGTGGAGMGSSTTSGVSFDGGIEDGALTPDNACVATVAEATLTKRPVDIIFVIDNSSSMADEILSVQNNINESFAAIIEASGIDYRVILLAQHGSALENDSVCIGAPLSATSCSPVPEQPGNNPPFFYHYSYPNESHDSLCNLLASYNGGVPDQFGLAPNGWSEWLRADSLKVFVQITDDSVACQTSHLLADNVYLSDRETAEWGETVAAQFEQLLFGLQPAVFGDASSRNYIFHSIVGVAENQPATDAWQPDSPMILAPCGTAVTSGTGYQALSKTTGGLRFPLCRFESYDVVFEAIAEGVITGAVVACEYEVPVAPPGETIALDTVVVEYTPGSATTPARFSQVPEAGACAAGSFYIEGGTIKLCPDACAAVQSDASAMVNILYGCDPKTM